jgi:ethanolaminephosphotransferase
VSLFTYQTLDAIDGKHARRTGAGSPLGELFDHGCDALGAPFTHCLVVMMLDYDDARSMVHCALAAAGLSCAIFEQYCTGTLDLGVINAPVDGTLVVIGSFLWTAVVGREWWSTPMDGVAALPYFSEGCGMRPHDFIYAFTVTGFVMTVVPNLMHAVTMPKVHGAVNRKAAFVPIVFAAGLYAAVLPLMPTVVTCAVPFAFEMCFGLLASFHATRLTISRLCRSPYIFASKLYSANVTFLCVAAVTVLGGLTGMQEFAFGLSLAAAGVAVFGVAAYLHMIISVFRQFSTHLGINVLTLTAAQHKAIADRLQRGDPVAVPL